MKFEKNIFADQFRLEIYIDRAEHISTKVYDLKTNEEYTLYKVLSAQGSFVGNIRNEVEHILKEISETCFEKEIFKNHITKEIIEYVEKKYNDKPEFLWNSPPDYAIFRRKDTKKWYAFIGAVKKEKLGLIGNEKSEIINLRIERKKMPFILDGTRYFSAYHMNKKNRVTILLNGSVPAQEIKNLLDKTYDLTLKNKKC